VTPRVSRQLDSFDRDTQFAVRTVRGSIRLARSLEGRARASIKSDASPVTVADLSIQAIVAARLAGAFPTDSLIAEEDARLLRTDPDLSRQVTEVVRQVITDATIGRVVAWIGDGGSGVCSRCWTLDPIDGTKGFLHGRQYVIALALIVDGGVQVSVIGCPRLSLRQGEGAVTIGESTSDGGIAIAVRGHGAWWSAAGEDTCHRLAVSTRRDGSIARVVQSFEGRHGDPQRFARVLRSIGNVRSPLLMDSQAKHVTVAAGASDLLMRFPPHAEFHDAVWDQAAGSLLIEEAGGRVTDLAGQPLDFTSGRHLFRNTGVLASNGLLHQAALEAVQRAP
jgi:3'(2'), 5'-bisphosphate nucleotidase